MADAKTTAIRVHEDRIACTITRRLRHGGLHGYATSSLSLGDLVELVDTVDAAAMS